MPSTVDFYFSPVSPWTYLGMPRFRAMTAKYGAEVSYKPVDMVQLFASAGVKPVKERPEPIRRNRMTELGRWCRHLGMELNLEPKYFPTSALLANKMIIAAVLAGDKARDVGALAEGYLRACWVEERNLAEEATVVAVADECGFEGRSLREAAKRPAIAAAFAANTKEALARYVWGSPSYVVDGELFFGQDRLFFVEEKLAQG